MIVCLHFPIVGSNPIGIWYWNEKTEQAEAFYLNSANSFYYVSEFFSNIKSEKQWETWALRMSERTPVEDSFEIMEIFVSPETFLTTYTHMMKS